MSDNPKIAMLAGDSFGRNVGVWRVASAVRDEAYGETAPCVTVEAGRAFSPWEDVVEQWSDGRMHVWQVKSGADVTREELVTLVRKLRDELPVADGTIVTRMNARVPGLPGGLGELDRILRATRSGGLVFAGARCPWEDFFCEVCGSAASAEKVVRRLHVEFIGSFETALEWTSKELRCVYEAEAIDAILDRLCSAVDAAIGSPLSVSSLRRTGLLPFENRRLGALPATVDSLRAEYGRAVAAAIASRRVLRDVRQDGARLSEVWTDLRISTSAREEFSADTLSLHLHAGQLHMLVAPAGAGKTEVLARTAAQIAQVALSSSEAPLPLLLPARSISASQAMLAAGAEDFVPGITDLLVPLLRHPGLRWVVLVDGFDEVPHGVELLDKVRHRFPEATILATARPTIGRAIDVPLRFQIEPWSPSESEFFISGFVRAHPEHGSTLRSIDTHAGALLDRPLTASLAAVVVVHECRVPASRAELFRVAVPVLVERWAERRSIAHRWETIADDMRHLALDFVRGERQSISRAELGELARRAAPDRSATLQHAAEVDFGLLVPTRDGYEFLLRGLAEHLAGELLAQSDENLLDAAPFAWASESVRCALGLVAESDVQRFVNLLRKILSCASSSGSSLGNLRALLVAIRSAVDVGVAATDVASELSECCLARLLDESSPWRADRVADAVAALAQRGGPCWDRIQAGVIATLSDPRDPEDYYRALQPQEPEVWLQALLHCDPGVRCEAIRRLGAHLDQPAVITCLVWMLQDTPAFPFWGVPPAIEAGLCLRNADRNGSMREYLALVRSLSAAPGQIAPAAAAVALRPDEHDKTVLARALRAGADGKYVPERMVDELGSSAEGAAALDAAWPDWRTYRRSEPARQRRSPMDAREPAPPSRWSRRRVVASVRVAIARDQELATILADTIGDAARDLYIEAVCEEGLIKPDEAMKLLTIPADRFPLLSPRAQDLLGLVVVRHPEVRAQLLDIWQAFAALSHSRRMMFPGGSLEPLVTADDIDAVRVYSEWLPHSAYACGFYSGRTPDPRVLSRVSTTARAIVDGVWTQATKGFVDSNGKRVFLAPGSAASVLKQFALCWRGDFDIAEGLLGWLGADDPNTRLAGMSGLQHAILNAGQRAALTESLGAALSTSGDIHSIVTVPYAVRLAHVHDLVRTLLAEITALAERCGPAAIAAACVVRSVVPDVEARRLSEQTAARSVDVLEFDHVDPDDLAEMVALAPDKWSESVLRQVAARGALNLGLLVPIYQALPVANKRTVAKQLRTLAEGWDLPWCAHDFRGDLYRPFDLVEQLLFDAGEV